VCLFADADEADDDEEELLHTAHRRHPQYSPHYNPQYAQKQQQEVSCANPPGQAERAPKPDKALCGRGVQMEEDDEDDGAEAQHGEQDDRAPTQKIEMLEEAPNPAVGGLMRPQ